MLAACGGDDDPVPPAATSTDTFLPPEGTSGFTPKAIVYSNREMVAAANPLAVDAGAAILAAGGSAVDAAIATQMVLNLVEPQSSGIGGGAFMLHYKNAENKLVAFDGRETAPAAATPNMFLNATTGAPLPFATALNGGLSVGTPGVVKMLEDAHKKHGKLPWKDLFAPAIKMSRDGFPISQRLFTLLDGNTALRTQQPASTYFYQADPADATKLVPKPVGSLLKNPELAASLELLANGGAAAFYTGALAQAIVDKVAAHPTNPGRLTWTTWPPTKPKNGRPCAAPTA